MRWQNSEVPTFEGNAGDQITGPNFVESMQLLDRFGNVVASFGKAVNGSYSLSTQGAVSQSGLLAYRSADLSRNQDTVSNQVETATITGGPVVAQAQIVVTASGMSNSPKTIKFAIANGDTAAQIATKARAALTADSDVAAFFTVSGATDKIILTAKAKAANDGTMNIASDNDTCGGLTTEANSANTTAGAAAVLQKETATVVGTITVGTAQVETATVVGTIASDGAGDAEVIVTADGMPNSPKTILVPVANSDTASDVAGKIRTALIADADVGDVTTGFFTVTGATDKVILTAKTKAADDTELNISVDNGDCTGLTPELTSADTTPGVAPGTGNASVIITAAGMSGSPITVPVAVVAADDASAVAGKIRTALGLNATIAAFFTISGATDKVILEAKAAAANDATMNISVDNGTCTGLTSALTSANTTAGILGVLQVETATIVGTGDVKCEIVVTAAGMTNSPKTISVPVADGDTAAQVAAKVIAALAADVDVSAFFSVGGTGALVVLTVLVDDDYDSTINLASDNDTCAGLTTEATSANTTPLESDVNLSVDVEVGTYLIEGQLSITTDSGGFKSDLASGSAEVDNVLINYQLYDSDGAIYGFTHSTALATGPTISESDADDYVLDIKGTIEVSIAGTIALGWTQKVDSATDSTVSRGSWLRGTKV
jgi:phage tail sheath gpL-like